MPPGPRAAGAPGRAGALTRAEEYVKPPRPGAGYGLFTCHYGDMRMPAQPRLSLP